MEELYPFFTFLNRFVEVSRSEFETYIQPYVVLRKFDARQVVSHAGAVENYFNFLLTGLARTYYKKEADEIVIQIATEGHVIHAQESFHKRQPSKYFVETIEPSCFASITYNGLEMIYTTNSKMQHLGRLVVTFTMLLKEKMQWQTVTLSPRERFFHFMERYPGLLRRVPQKYIASYLNIKPETFSRFKHLLRAKRMAED